MKKIEIPKNTWISDISLDFFKEGYWSSALGLSITFTGNPCPGMDFLAEVIAPLSSIELPKRKIVRFKGLYNPTDQTMDILIRALKSWGFMVQAILNCDQPYSWCDKLDWTILRIQKPFAPFWANEIWYAPPATDTLPEPLIPPKDTLLYVARGYSVATTIQFITHSDKSWNLL